MSPLRVAILGVCGAAILGGAIALAAGAYPAGGIFAFWGLVLALGTVFERVFYKKTQSQPPGPGWERTAERFVDEPSGRPVTVYIEPKTGERQYVFD